MEALKTYAPGRNARIQAFTPLLAACLLIAGCTGLEEPRGASRRADSLYVKTAAAWEKGKAIGVCFGANVTAADRTAALAGAKVWQNVINISFVDVGTCPGSGFQGIRVTDGDEMVVRGGLGQQSDGISDMEIDTRSGMETEYAACSADGLSRAACIKRICVHEFGHTLGFAHEQNRPDNFGQCTEGVGSGSDGDTTFGEFDVDSVMSYCSFLRGLTPTDAYGAVAVYGMAPALVSALL